MHDGTAPGTPRPLGPLATHEERRLVTVLFADVVGSTSMGEALDPEDVRVLLARLFAIARDAIERHGGLVEKFIGDAVMAVFGLPVAHDDDAARALSAALDFRDRVRSDAFLGERVAIRLGVNTGEVIAAPDAAASGPIVVGDAVNTAARLEQGADPWTILAGERTVRSAGTRFRWSAPVELSAKGKAQPVQARILEGMAAAGAVRADAPAIVGRDADLAQLRLVAERAFDERRPYLVSVVAPAGVGKSRLLEAFLDELATREGSDPRPLIALAQCLPYGQRLTYWPLRGLALEILGVAEDTPPDAVRRAFYSWLTAAGDPDPSSTADELAATLGSLETDSADRATLHAAWRRFVELAARQRPVVLVVEDLHWSSDSLLDLVETILAPHDDVPLLMIVLARPELLDRRPGWGGGRRSAVTVALEPLPARAVAALVRGLLSDPDPALVEAVVARAEGNPFYAGEIVRSLIDLLGEQPDAHAVDAAIAALPDTVHATVLARLDALEPAARRTVQVGSVLGRTFQRNGITALEPAIEGPTLDGALESLIDRDFVRPAGVTSYAFRHILLREVAYGTLPRAERARLHALAGEYLEATALASDRADELAELVAFHLREATSLRAASGLPDDPALTERAVAWLERAGALAAGGAATVEAARHLEGAAVLATGLRRALILERIGTVHVGGDRALEAFEMAFAIARDEGADRTTLLRIRVGAATVVGRWSGSLSSRPAPDVVTSLVGELHALMAGVDEPRVLLGAALAELFLGTLGDGDAVAQRAAADEALRLAEALNDDNLLSAALDAATFLGMSDRDSKALARAARYADRRAALTLLNTDERADAIIMGAWTRFLLGDLVGAEAAAHSVASLLAPGMSPGLQLGASAWRVDALTWLGRWDEALVEAERSHELWRESEIRSPQFALNAFTRAWWISGQRRDDIGGQRWADVVRQITSDVAPGDWGLALRAAVEGTARGRATLQADWARYGRSTRLDHLVWMLMLLTDARDPLDAVALEGVRSAANAMSAPLLEAAALRGIALAGNDAAGLDLALALFERSNADAAVARVRADLGVRRGDRTLVDSAAAMLERMGDVRHLELVERAWRARSASGAR